MAPIALLISNSFISLLTLTTQSRLRCERPSPLDSRSPHATATSSSPHIQLLGPRSSSKCCLKPWEVAVTVFGTLAFVGLCLGYAYWRDHQEKKKQKQEEAEVGPPRLQKYGARFVPGQPTGMAVPDGDVATVPGPWPSSEEWAEDVQEEIRRVGRTGYLGMRWESDVVCDHTDGEGTVVNSETGGNRYRNGVGIGARKGDVDAGNSGVTKENFKKKWLDYVIWRQERAGEEGVEMDKN